MRQPDGPYSNPKGMIQPALYGVGHLMVFARIARYAFNFRLSFDDILLSNPGNQSFNYFYTQRADGASLDEVGISFLTDDDYGYPLTIIYNETTQLYHDSTNAQLGDEILTSWTLKPVDFTVGVPQCSFLDLDMVVQPQSALSNASALSCPTGAQALAWGDVVSDDYFYYQEAVWSNQFNIITLSPFNTGMQNSSVSTVAIALRQNGNVFAHIRMAIYSMEDSILAETNEVTVDNPQDTVLYLQLNQSVLLRAATDLLHRTVDGRLAVREHAAPHAPAAAARQSASDALLCRCSAFLRYTAAGAYATALCYYGLQYGYDLQPWPSSIGSKEAEYTLCKPLPVAAYGCQVAVGPPLPPPECPACPVCPGMPSSSSAVAPPVWTSTSSSSLSSSPVSSGSVVVPSSAAAPGWSSSSSSGGASGPPADEEKSGVSVGSVVGIVLLAIVLSAVTAGMAVYYYLSGKCKRGSGGDGGIGLVSGSDDSSSGPRFSRLSD